MSQVIIITGMGRSGTSLVSSLLQSGGVHIGDRLLPPYPDNPRGYFEDVDFYEFHEQLLHARQQTYLYVDAHSAFEPTSAERERALNLVSQRAGRPIWGWKDPRTALFLDFWHQLLPDARFLFVYRHPMEVLLSLVRRGEFDNHPYLAAGLQAWQVFNSNIATFYERHPKECLLAHIDAVVTNGQRFVQLLQRKLRLDVRLEAETFDRIYHAKELQKTPLAQDVVDNLAKLYPELLALYQRLNVQADLPPDTNRPSTNDLRAHPMLARLTAALPEPVTLPVKLSMLQLLVALLAPEPSETMLSRFQQNVKGAQRTVEHLWLEVQRLERTTDEQAKILQIRQNWLEVQQGELDAQQNQLEAQRRELQAQQIQLEAQQAQMIAQHAKLEAQQAELQHIRETRTWRLMQSYSRIKDKWEKKAG